MPNSMWIFNKLPFANDDVPEGAVGFIYIMSVVIKGEKKYYIGKKNFYSNRKVHFGKKEVSAITDKRLKTYKIVSKLDFQNYHSSNKILKEAHKNKIPIKRAILKICYSKTELTYYETKYLFNLNVLETDVYLNDNILGKFYSMTEKNKDLIKDAEKV